MSEGSGKIEVHSTPDPTSEELRWRMEKVIQHAAATRDSLEASAGDFNKALAILGGQDNEVESSD